MSPNAKLSLYDYPPRPEADDGTATASTPATAPTADTRIAALEAQVRELWAIIRTLHLPERLPHGVEKYVTLDQAAALVHRSKRTLEHYRERMPDADVPGGGGRSSLWKWSTMRVWLTKTFGVPLPEQYPY